MNNICPFCLKSVESEIWTHEALKRSEFSLCYNCDFNNTNLQFVNGKISYASTIINNYDITIDFNKKDIMIFDLSLEELVQEKDFKTQEDINRIIGLYKVFG